MGCIPKGLHRRADGESQMTDEQIKQLVIEIIKFVKSDRNLSSVDLNEIIRRVRLAGESRAN